MFLSVIFNVAQTHTYRVCMYEMKWLKVSPMTYQAVELWDLIIQETENQYVTQLLNYMCVYNVILFIVSSKQARN